MTWICRICKQPNKWWRNKCSECGRQITPSVHGAPPARPKRRYSLIGGISENFHPEDHE